MKKTAFFAAFACLLFSSCLKDGFNDFDALNHPMSFHGVVNPTLGVPIGEGSATIYDMLHMVQLSTATMEVGSDSILTITYDTTMSFHIDMDNSKKKHHRGTKSDIVYVSSNNIEGSVAVDLFDNITILNDADLEVDSLLVYLQAYVKASAEDSAHTLNAIQNYHVQVYYDQLSISIVGQDNNLYNVMALDDSIPITDIIHGSNIVLFNNTDISNMINKRPKEIRYSARMNIAFEAAFFSTLGISEEQFVADSIGVQAVDIDADLLARFPVSAYINNLQYQTDIEFSPSIHLNDLMIDSSMIYLECENGIPLSLLIHAQFVDNNDQLLCDVLNTTVEGATVGLVNNHYIAVNQTTSILQIPVTETVFESLLNTSKIRLTAGLNTSDTSLHRRVAIRANDQLKLRVYAKLKPSYTLDFDLGGNTEGGDK